MQKKVPYVAQLGNMDCSIACMTMLFRYYGLDVDIVDVGQVVHIGRDGVNLTQLKQATQQFGFKCTAYRYNKQKNILDSNLPAEVYSGSHLAVIGSKTVLGQYILLDPIKTIFTLDNGTRVVYKPHSLTVDRRYQECLKSIGVHTKYDMRTIEILDCGDYGWEAYDYFLLGTL